MNRFTLRQVIDWAKSKNCEVEKTGKRYEVWNKNDHSVIDTCSTLQEVVNSVHDLGDSIDHDKNYSQKIQDNLEPIE